jgi:ABC-type glutathione transport system ATPase component
MTEHGFIVECLGHRIDIGFEGDGADKLAAQAKEAWERCLVSTPASEPAHHIRVFVGADLRPARDEAAVSAPSHEAAMEMLSQAVTLAGVTRSAGELLMLHAAGLADPDTGRTAVLVGPSGMGKSTATKALGREWGYVSDETIAVTAAGDLLAYPKPLSLIEDGRWKRQASPASLGLLHAPAALRPACLVLLDRRAGGAGTIREVPLTEAVARAAEQTSYLGDLEGPLQRVAAVVREVGCVEVSYAETHQLHDAVADLMASRA